MHRWLRLSWLSFLNCLLATSAICQVHPWADLRFPALSGVPGTAGTALYRVSGNDLYVTNFTGGLGKVSGGLASFRIDGLDLRRENVPAVQGTVFAVESDGMGGIVVGGSFSQAGDSLRRNLLHLDSNLNILPSPDMEGTIVGLARVDAERFLLQLAKGEGRTTWALWNHEQHTVVDLGAVFYAVEQVLPIGNGKLLLVGTGFVWPGDTLSSNAPWCVVDSLSLAVLDTPKPDPVYGMGLQAIVSGDTILVVGSLYKLDSINGLQSISIQARNRLTLEEIPGFAQRFPTAEHGIDAVFVDTISVTFRQHNQIGGETSLSFHRYGWSGNLQSVGVGSWSNSYSHIAVSGNRAAFYDEDSLLVYSITNGLEYRLPLRRTYSNVNSIALDRQRVWFGGSFYMNQPEGELWRGPGHIRLADRVVLPKQHKSNSSHGLPYKKGWIAIRYDKSTSIWNEDYQTLTYYSAAGVPTDLAFRFEWFSAFSQEWNPGGATLLALSGDTLLISGSFNRVNGSECPSLIAVDLRTNQQLPIKYDVYNFAGPDIGLQDLQIYRGKVFITGEVGIWRDGIELGHIGVLDLQTGSALLPIALDDSGFNLAFQGDVCFVSGKFERFFHSILSINNYKSLTASRIAAFNINTGLPVQLPAFNRPGEVLDAIAVHGNTLHMATFRFKRSASYATGSYYDGNIISFNINTGNEIRRIGEIESYYENLSAPAFRFCTFRYLHADDSLLVAGGSFHRIGNFIRHGILVGPTIDAGLDIFVGLGGCKTDSLHVLPIYDQYLWKRDGQELAHNGNTLPLSEPGHYQLSVFLSKNHRWYHSKVIEYDGKPPFETGRVLASDSVICAQSQTINLQASQTRVIEWYLDGNSLGITNINLEVSKPGTYTYHFQDSCGVFHISLPYRVKNSTSPLPGLLQSSGTILCNGNIISLYADQMVLGWYRNSTLIPAANGQQLVVTDSGSYTYTYQSCGYTGESNSILIQSKVPTTEVTMYPDRISASNLSSIAPSWYVDWEFAGNRQLRKIADATQWTLQVHLAGNYWLKCESADGCFQWQGPFSYSQSSPGYGATFSPDRGWMVTDYNGKAFLYPNPVTDQLFLLVDESHLKSVRIYSTNGQLHPPSFSRQGPNLVLVDVSALGSGTYILVAELTHQTIYSRLVIK
jgi:hypothetical protein